MQNRRQLYAAVLLAAAVAACGPRYLPARNPAPREATTVGAPFDSTWTAVVGYFASRNIPIRTIEKASGIIVAEASRADLLPNRGYRLDEKGNHMYRDGKPVLDTPVYADCGVFDGVPLDPRTGAFNVFVRPSGGESAIRVSVKYTSQYQSGVGPIPVDCSSLGKWETELETLVKKQVEGKR